MKYTLGKNTTDNLESILIADKAASCRLVDAVKDFIQYTPIDFCIIENGGYRSAALQNQLYKLGNSKCDGYVNKSKHQSGLAVDLVPWVNGKASWDKKSAFYLAGAFLAYCKQRRIPVTCGADWNGDGVLLDDSWDPCHMQIEDI